LKWWKTIKLAPIMSKTNTKWAGSTWLLWQSWTWLIAAAKRSTNYPRIITAFIEE
jgi:hypothetical protein